MPARPAVPGGAAARNSGGTSSSSGSGKVIKLGLLTSLTGDVASSFGQTTVAAAQAAVDQANAEHVLPGVQLQLVTADDQSSPAGGLSGFKYLVQQQHVFAVLSASPFFYAAEPFAAQQKVPVLGAPFDPSWADSKNANLFAIWGSSAADYPDFANLGTYFEKQGATSFCGGRRPVALFHRRGQGTGLLARPRGPQDPLRQRVPAVVDHRLQHGGSFDQVGRLRHGGRTTYQLPRCGADPGDEQPRRQAEGVLLLGRLRPVAAAGSVDPGCGPGLRVRGPVRAADAQHPGHQAAAVRPGEVRRRQRPQPQAGTPWGWFPAQLAIEGFKVAGINATQSQYISQLRKVSSFDYGGLTCPVDFTKFAYVPSIGNTGCTWIAVPKGDTWVSAIGTSPIMLLLVPGTSNS